MRRRPAADGRGLNPRARLPFGSQEGSVSFALIPLPPSDFIIHHSSFCLFLRLDAQEVRHRGYLRASLAQAPPTRPSGLPQAT